MLLQPRIFGNQLTKEQSEIEEWTFEAGELLKENGFDCIVEKQIVTSPSNYPAHIHIISKI